MNEPLWLQDLAAYSFQAGVMILAGSLLPRLLRLPKVRLAYWQTLLAICLLLPFIQPWRPDVLPLDKTELTSHAGVTLGPTVITTTTGSLAEIIFLVLLSGALLRALWVALGMWRLAIYRRRARRVQEVIAPVEEAQRCVGVHSNFYLSHDLASPATFGLRNPVVLLPNRFFALPPAMQKAIACHELLHVARRDWAWTMAEELILMLLWFHPAVWWVVWNIRLSREQAVDAEVIRLTESRRAYLDALLEMAQHQSTPRSVPVPMFLHEGQLAQRVALMVKEVSMSRSRLIATLLTAAAALWFTGWASARAFPLEAPATPSASAPKPEAAAHPTPIPSPTDYRVGGNSQLSKPVPVFAPDPPYTQQAVKAHVEGTIVVDVVVNAEGKVISAKEVSKALGMGLDESAIHTIRTWKFKPGMLDGKPVPVRTLIEVRFRLPGNKKPKAT